MTGIMQMLVGGSFAPPPPTNYIASLYGAASTTNTSLGITVDSSGNSYICGQSQDASFNSYCAVAKYDSSGSYQWQKTVSTTSALFNGVTSDSSNNIYCVGKIPISGIDRLALIKFDSAGSTVWGNYLYSSDATEGTGVCLDSSGNVYIVGTITTSATLNNILIAKYNSSGTIQWQRKLSGTYNDNGYGIAVDSSNNVYVIGESYNSSGYSQLFLAKYDSSGTIQWQKLLGAGTSGNQAKGAAIKIDSSNNIYVTGYNTVSSNPQLLIVKYNTSGVVQWQKYIGIGSGSTSGSSISTDSLGNVYAVGTGGSSNSGVMVKYDSSGTIQWQRKIGATSASQNRGIFISFTDVMYVTGRNSTGGSPVDWLFESLPIDGSKTGTYTVNGLSITYATGSMTAGTPTLPESTASLTDAANSHTSSSFTPSFASNNLTSSVTTI